MYFCSICVTCMLGYKLSMICIADRNKNLFVCLFCLCDYSFYWIHISYVRSLSLTVIRTCRVQIQLCCGSVAIVDLRKCVVVSY